MQVLFPIIEKHPDWFENVTVIYDAEAVFATRDIARRKLAGAPMTEAEATAAVKTEIKLAAAADRVISVSETERDTFVKNGIARVEVLGHSIKTQPSPNAFEDREGFLFVGAIKEASPNSDSVIWFVEEILPIIHSRLGRRVRVTIAGLCDAARVRELASPAIRIAGVVDDLSDLYNQSRVFIAPTRYGAGIPHKVHEAAAHGLPTVVTPLLAEQLNWRDGSEIAVGADARSFAEACIRIHEDRKQWLDLRTNALARIETECSVEAFDRQLEQILRNP
jgi:glycosyltransferase involved in cell wall biosynthesis